MAGGDPHAQRSGPDDELEWRLKLDCLAVDAGAHRCCRVYLELRGSPGPSGRIRAGAWCVEHDNAELAGVEPRPGPRRDWAIERVGVVRHEHDGEAPVLVAQVVDELQFGHGAARAEYLGGRFHQRPHLRLAVGRLTDGIAVDPERDVVEKDPAVYLTHIDRSLDAVRERIERTDQVLPIDAEVEREMVAGARRNAHERESVFPCSRGDDRK